ncbi:MAG: nucleoside-diphosphate kinase [Erysipelothrix sp.]|nr:nucleoside-diphosphate kinase [Erysipelothrix sp.]
MERTFIMVKPDGVSRKLIGEVVKRFENKGYNLVGAKLVNMEEEVAKEHYVEHKERPFFGELVEFITSGPVFCMVWEGNDIVAISRTMIGPTSPLDMVPGTIRGDFSSELSQNIIHGSDSVESAEREIALHFDTNQLI